MTEIRKIGMSLTCPHYTTSVLMLITSVCMFVVSLTLKFEFLVFENYLDNYYGKPIWFLFAGSIVIMADAFLGLISLAQRWYKGIIAFLIFTVHVFVTMIVLVALTYSFSITAEESMYLRLKNDITNYTTNSHAIDTIQAQLNCCGYENFNDWKNQSIVIPQSCCSFNVSCDTENLSEIRSMGCRDALESFMNFRKLYVAVILGALGTVEIVSIVLSCIVCKGFTRKIMPISTSPTVHIEGSGSTSIPRLHNPLGKSGHLANDDARPREPYVRRPAQVPLKLDYRNRHEIFLRQQPQRRFDMRY